MGTRGFEYLGHAKPKGDGTTERMEINANNDVLKKYTRPDGTTYNAVQMGGQKSPDFHKGVEGQDNLAGFRSLFGND